MALIEVEHLRKTFSVAVPRKGRMAAVRSLLAREYRQINAVDDVSFHIERGEMVGYLGPNGAGKSTTLKMLTGILVPTSGHMHVAGRVPYQQREQHARQIGVVFGQRTQLWWDLPTLESFELLRYIYRIPMDRWQANLRHFSDMLELEPFLHTPVRQLSLGQRMRADLACALMHEPPVLFLDEPTIGLDVVARERIREFLRLLNRERGVTIILTTHDLGDIERLCQRVVLIDHGRVIYDGGLAMLRERYGRWRTLVVELEEELPAQSSMHIPGAELIRREGLRHWLRFDRSTASAASLIATIAAQHPLRDLTIEEPEIEMIVSDIYQGKSL